MEENLDEIEIKGKKIKQSPCFFCGKPTPHERWVDGNWSGGRLSTGYFTSRKIGNVFICSDCLSELHSELQY